MGECRGIYHPTPFIEGYELDGAKRMELKNNADYYNLLKIASDLKDDLKHLKHIGVDPRSFLAGKCYDYVAQVESLVVFEKRLNKEH
jgi:hypothetical protein